MSSLLLALALGVSGERLVVNDPAHEYQFSLPGDFAPKPDTALIGPNENDGVLGVWMWAPAPEKIIVVSLEAIGGTIGRDDAEVMKRLGEPFPVKWKSFDFSAARITHRQDDVDMVVLLAQLPSKPAAIQLVVGGPVSNEAAIRAVFDDALAHFDAPSNWLTDDERIKRTTEGVLRLATTFVVLIIVVGAIVRAIRKKPTQK